MISVFIVASSPESRARLRTDVAVPEFEVVGTSPDLVAVDEQLLDAEPDVIVVEQDRDSMGGNWGELAPLAERTRVVLLAAQPDQVQVSRAFREGSLAVLSRDLSGHQLRTALQAVAAGLVVIHPSILGSLLPSLQLVSAPPPLAEPLTKREREVLQMLAAGFGNKEVAARLSISEHTAKFHVASILGKLGAATRTEAVTIAMRHGLILL